MCVHCNLVVTIRACASPVGMAHRHYSFSCQTQESKKQSYLTKSTAIIAMTGPISSAHTFSLICIIS